jgi:hypothetical protein
MIKEKTGLELKNKVNILKYENTTAISDFAETYELGLNSEDYNKVIKLVHGSVKHGGWEKIEKGYQLTIPQKTTKDTMFIFFIDEKSKRLEVQIIEE